MHNGSIVAVKPPAELTPADRAIAGLPSLDEVMAHAADSFAGASDVAGSDGGGKAEESGVGTDMPAAAVADGTAMSREDSKAAQHPPPVSPTLQGSDSEDEDGEGALTTRENREVRS